MNTFMKPKQSNTPIRILLADDDKDDRFLFSKALKEIEIQTQLITVHDGEQLTKYLNDKAENIPDVLFLDLNMPRKNGFECLAEIKLNANLKDFPIIMLSTSYPRDKNYEQDMITLLTKIGASDFIRKPDDFTQLKMILQDSLTRFMENKAQQVA